MQRREEIWNWLRLHPAEVHLCILQSAKAMISTDVQAMYWSDTTF